MVVPHRRADRPLQAGRPPVNRELRVVVEDEEHFFDVVVVVVADAPLGRHLTAEHVKQIRLHLLALDEGHHVHALGGTLVPLRVVPVLGWIGPADA